MIHFLISTRYLFSKKYKYLPSFSVVLAFFGVFISVATLILVLSVMNGFKEDFEKYIEKELEGEANICGVNFKRKWI